MQCVGIACVCLCGHSVGCVVVDMCVWCVGGTAHVCRCAYGCSACMCVACVWGWGVTAWWQSRITKRTSSWPGSHRLCLECRAELSLLCGHWWPWLPSEHGPEASGHHRRSSELSSRLWGHLPTLPSCHLLWQASVFLPVGSDDSVSSRRKALPILCTSESISVPLFALSLLP